MQTLPADLKKALHDKVKEDFYYEDLPSEIALEMWERFAEALVSLKRKGKLGAILFQYPPWFVKKRSNIEHVLLCAQMLEGFQLAIEFRNNTWFNERHVSSTLDLSVSMGSPM